MLNWLAPIGSGMRHLRMCFFLHSVKTVKFHPELYQLGEIIKISHLIRSHFESSFQNILWKFYSAKHLRSGKFISKTLFWKVFFRIYVWILESMSWKYPRKQNMEVIFKKLKQSFFCNWRVQEDWWGPEETPLNFGVMIIFLDDN